MQTLAETAVALTFIGATTIGTTATLQAQGYGYYQHHTTCPYRKPNTIGLRQRIG